MRSEKKDKRGGTETKHKGVLKFILLLTVCLILAGCTGTPTPPVDTAKNAAKLIEEDLTLDEVYALMTTRLKETTTLYPALGIEQQADGNWQFRSAKDGLPEDADVPFHALIFIPARSGGKYYMVFFEDGSVIGDDWFSYSRAALIKLTLGGTLIAE